MCGRIKSQHCNCLFYLSFLSDVMEHKHSTKKWTNITDFIEGIPSNSWWQSLTSSARCVFPVHCFPYITRFFTRSLLCYNSPSISTQLQSYPHPSPSLAPVFLITQIKSADGGQCPTTCKALLGTVVPHKRATERKGWIEDERQKREQRAAIWQIKNEGDEKIKRPDQSGKREWPR